MAAYKAGAVAGVLRSPPKQVSVFLLYGPDAGLVSERSASLARALAGAGGSIERLDERDIAEAPDRLHVALRSSGLFGGAPIVRIAAGGRVNAELIRSLLETELDGRLVVESGPLKPGAPLRTLFEKEPRAAALPCFSSEGDLPAMIDEELKGAGKSIARDARAALLSLLGADLAVSRNEVRKLVLYCSEQAEIALADVEAVVGDVASAALDSFVDGVGSGDAAGAIAELARLEAAGVSPQAALSALARHLADLHRAALAASDIGADAAIRGMRPPPHFSRQRTVAAQIRNLGPDGAARALMRVQQTIFNARLNGDLEAALIEQLVIEIAQDGKS